MLQQSSDVTLTADCNQGLTIQTLDDTGKIASNFVCGDIDGPNGTFPYGSDSLTLYFTNSTSQT